MSKKTRDHHVPKLCGADIELGNFLTGSRPGFEGGSSMSTAAEASRALLRQIRGFPKDNWARSSGSYGFNPQDIARTFLSSNGGCCYIDLNHLEVCIPEVRSAQDHLAAWHAMLRIADDAREAANASLGGGRQVVVMVNNSDGSGQSYGSHLSFLITRSAFDDLFSRRLHYLLFLASYQCSSIIFTGQGKVGSENGAPQVDYQIAQRADFFETLVGVQTTEHRPLVNTRDEALCGSWAYSRDVEEPPSDRWRRFHCIFYDSTLSHTASLLKVGVMQIMLSMVEARRMDPGLILDLPLAAVQVWSHDPELKQTARLACGRRITAVEHQWRFHELARKFVEEGGCEGLVPGASGIVQLWGETLTKLERRDYEGLAPDLDWVLKRLILQRALGQNASLSWESPELKHLDHLYGTLGGGFFWTYLRQGLVRRWVTEGQIERFMHEPPADTRAALRASILRQAEPEEIVSVDWDRITLRLEEAHRPWPTHTTIHLPDPLQFEGDTSGAASGARAYMTN